MMKLFHLSLSNSKMFYRLLSLFIGLSFVLSACQNGPQTPVSPTPSGTFAVDSLFREYYADLGGEARLGPAISPLVERDNLKCQYTLAVLMCLNPEITGSGRFYLSSLGVKIGIHEDPPPAPEKESTLVLDGYPIYPAFAQMINTLRGQAVVGKPLTAVHFDYERQRVEQYFENVAFSFRFNDPAGAITLLPYGWYYCGEACQFDLPEGITFDPLKKAIDTPFATGLEKIGGLKTSGQALTQAYSTADGALEQVYENVVVYAPADKMDEIHLRPLARSLSMISTEPGPKKYGIDQNVIFYPVQGELGYHVPVVFDQFITQHGGYDFSGAPVAEAMFYENDVPRQCFENYCLDYYPTAAEGMQVRPVSLGRLYMQKFTPLSAVPTVMQPLKLTLTAHEKMPQIGGKDKQFIDINALVTDTQQPASDVTILLTLTLPDATQTSARLQPTDAQGHTSVEIPAMPALPNGSMIVYKVCSDEPGDHSACVYGSYLVWNQ
ncbi:MAG: hypothetical protein LWX83_07465, partial [Anaerolineae bacterium]|nr:hypothetical protein [Anaerolineae bacterium]